MPAAAMKNRVSSPGLAEGSACCGAELGTCGSSASGAAWGAAATRLGESLSSASGRLSVETVVLVTSSKDSRRWCDRASLSPASSRRSKREDNSGSSSTLLQSVIPGRHTYVRRPISPDLWRPSNSLSPQGPNRRPATMTNQRDPLSTGDATADNPCQGAPFLAAAPPRAAG